MKNRILLLAMLFATISVIAQAPEAVKYQAVVRDASGGILKDQNVGIKVTIHEGSAAGTTVYEETFTPTSNAFGLVNLNIGTGTVVSGTFATIDWGNNSYFVEIGLDPAGGTSYTVTGTSQLMSVPYALYAKESGTPGPIGPTGPAGVAGPTGPTGPGLTVTGSTGYTLYHDGTGFTGSDFLYNDGSSVSVGVPNSGSDFAVGATGSPVTVDIGHEGAYNDPESGRLIFEEDITAQLDTFMCGLQFHMDGAQNRLFLTGGCTTPTLLATFERGGDIGINMVNPTVELEVNGTAAKTGGGSWAVSSDRRLKKDIRPFNDGLSAILQINPVRFRYNGKLGYKDDEEFVGIIAQDMLEIAPYTVTEFQVEDEPNPEDKDYEGGPAPGTQSESYYRFDPSALDFMLINAIKEQQQLIEELREEIEQLKSAR